MPSRIFWPFLLPAGPRCTAPGRRHLVTLPMRDATQLTIYNSEDITMVREYRLLPSSRASIAFSSREFWVLGGRKAGALPQTPGFWEA